MKAIAKLNPVFLFTIFLTVSLLLMGFKLNKDVDIIKAGTSRISITPEEPVRMSGYAARTEPFKGVHDDIYASAVVFDNGLIKTCIITADVIGFSHEYVDQTKGMIETETGISAENILITAAHNHGGPTTRAYGGEATEYEVNYVETLQKKMVQIVKDSEGKLQPVKIGVAKGTCKMNVNRRARHAEGGIWLGRNPEGICDDEVGVIRLDNMEGTTIGLLVNWPCHATTGGQENYMITGDWPGAAAREVEKAYPDAVVLVSAGASGDINPIYGPNNSFDDIDAIGQTLASEVIRISADVKTYPVKDLTVSNKVIKASGKKTSASRMPDVSLDPGPEVDIRISSFKIGSTLIAGISGELMNEIGLQVKEESPYKNTFIYTHCNGNSGYLCTDISYKEGGYEPMVARTMPGTEEKISNAFQKMNNEL
jgi:hypothetical protein